jgi:hypothetical protein
MFGFASGGDLRQQFTPPAIFSLRLSLGLVPLTKPAVGRRTQLQRRRQGQKCRVPLRQPILGQPLISTIVAKRTLCCKNKPITGKERFCIRHACGTTPSGCACHPDPEGNFG